MATKKNSDSGRALGTGAEGDPENPGTPFDAIPNTTPEEQQAAAEAVGFTSTAVVDGKEEKH